MKPMHIILGLGVSAMIALGAWYYHMVNEAPFKAAKHRGLPPGLAGTATPKDAPKAAPDTPKVDPKAAPEAPADGEKPVEAAPADAWDTAAAPAEGAPAEPADKKAEPSPAAPDAPSDAPPTP
jgi:hypothetical protein